MRVEYEAMVRDGVTPSHSAAISLGVPKARQIDYLIYQVSPHTYVPPWHRDFPADRSKWPADIRAEVEARLAESDSLPPDHVPPFDWRQMPYQYMRPFPRYPDGSPMPSAFRDDEAAEEEVTHA
jgi:hypothetical protein